MKKLFLGMAILLAMGMACNPKPQQTEDEGGNTIRINCLIKVNAENRDKVIELSKELVDSSLMDLGNIDYDVLASATDPSALMIYETWEDQSSLDAHSASSHFTRLVPQIQELAESMDIQQFTGKETEGVIRLNCPVEALEEDLDTVIVMAQELVEYSRQDEGNINYDLYLSLTHPKSMLFFETWQNQDALDKHSAADHFTRIVPQIQDLADMEVQQFLLKN